MVCKAGLIFLGTILTSAVSLADIITLATSPAAMGANDTVTWSQLGPDGTTIPNPFSAASTAGKSISGAFSSSTGMVAVAGTSWTPVTGDFSAGDSLIWSFDAAQNAGTGPVSFTFPSGFGAGAAIQADAPGQFTAMIELFNGAMSLGSATRTSDSAGDAMFIGALDNLPNVTRAVFSLSAAGPNVNNSSNYLGDFALDTLYLQNPPFNPAPEPSSLFLVGGVVVAVGYRLRRAQRSI